MASGDLTITLDQRDYRRFQTILNSMDKVEQGSTIQNALKQAGKIIQSAGKVNLAARNRVRKGNLKKSFQLKVDRKKAYALAGFRRPEGAASYLVDRGTEKRWTKKGYYRGSVSRNKPKTGSMFWTSAVEDNGGKALDTLMDAIYRSLDEINRRNQH